MRLTCACWSVSPLGRPRPRLSRRDGGTCYARPMRWIPPGFTHAYTNAHTCAHAHSTCKQMHTHTCTHVQMHMYLCAHSTHAHTGTPVHTRTHNADMHRCRCMHTHVYAHTYQPSAHMCMQHLLTHTPMSTHAGTCGHTQTHLSPSLLPRARRACPQQLRGPALASAWAAQGPLGPSGLSTSLSGDSSAFQPFCFSWCSSPNFMLTSSTDSCSMSQYPARSCDVGLGMALGS